MLQILGNFSRLLYVKENNWINVLDAYVLKIENSPALKVFKSVLILIDVQASINVSLMAPH